MSLTDRDIELAGERARQLAAELFESRRGYYGDESAAAQRYHAVLSVAVAWASPPVQTGQGYGALMSLCIHASEHMDGRERASWAPTFDGASSARSHAEWNPDGLRVQAARVADVLRVIEAAGVEFADEGRTLANLRAYVDTARELVSPSPMG